MIHDAHYYHNNNTNGHNAQNNTIQHTTATTGLYIASGLLAANLLDAVIRSQAFKRQTLSDCLLEDLSLDCARILPLCSAFYAVKHL